MPNQIPATIHDEEIRLIVLGKQLFMNHEDAQRHLQTIRNKFQTPKDSRENPDSQIIWIKFYDLTPEDKDAGLVGNFALFTVTKDKDDYYFIDHQKIHAQYKHPQRDHTKKPNPNRGVIDHIKSKNFLSEDAAKSALEKLYKDYLKACLNPRRDYSELYVQVWSGEKVKSGEPLEKIILYPVVVDNGYRIEERPNPSVDNTFRHDRIDEVYDQPYYSYPQSRVE